jgi:hypothetical protein
MPYHFDESDDEPQPQTQGGGRREPPRTGVLLDQMDAPEPHTPQPSVGISRSLAILGLIVFGGSALLLIAQSLLNFIHK